MISLRNKTIGFCKGCLVFQKTKRCVIHDDADVIAQKMLAAAAEEEQSAMDGAIKGNAALQEAYQLGKTL